MSHILNSELKYSFLFYSLVFFIFMCSYGFPSWVVSYIQNLGSWRFFIASIAIVVCGAIFAGKSFISLLGLKIDVKQTLICMLSGMIAFLVFCNLIDFVLAKNGFRREFFSYVPSDFFGQYPYISRTIWSVCQPLNEEIVLRALLLGWLIKYFKNRAFLAVVVAAVFPLLHYILYYIGVQNTPLNNSALLVLFFFALAANALFLTFNHIWFGFVIHFAWNWWRFAGDIFKDNILLNEAESFNALEGNSLVFLSVVGLALILVISLMVREQRISKSLIAA